MSTPILTRRYTEIVDSLLKQLNRVNIKDPLKFLQVRLYEYTLVHIGDLIIEMDNANVATLTKGLIELREIEDITKDKLVNCLVYYHQQDKLARRKYRSKTNNMIKTPEYEDRLDKLVLKTKNQINSHVDI